MNILKGVEKNFHKDANKRFNKRWNNAGKQDGDSLQKKGDQQEGQPNLEKGHETKRGARDRQKGDERHTNSPQTREEPTQRRAPAHRDPRENRN